MTENVLLSHNQLYYVVSFLCHLDLSLCFVVGWTKARTETEQQRQNSDKRKKGRRPTENLNRRVRQSRVLRVHRYWHPRVDFLFRL